MPTVLHVGCGRTRLPDWLDGYAEVRLDIDPNAEPDVCASMVDMGEIGPFDAIYTTHTLEHIYPHEVPVALGEFKRVLKPGGFAVIVVPDLEGVEATDEVLYDSPAGPVCGLDMIYGMSSLVAINPHMAHRCGFTAKTLREVLEAAGFAKVTTERSGAFNLIGGAVA